MWYNIIPSFMIITLALAAPHYISGPMNWLVLGNWFRRQILSKHEALQYLRDSRLGGPYVMRGLENIPDEDEDEDCQDD